MSSFNFIPKVSKVTVQWKSRTKTINLFDHIRDPESKIPFTALYRWFEILPLFAQYIIDAMKDRLDSNANRKINIDNEYEAISKILSIKSKAAIQRYCRDESEFNVNSVVSEYHLFDKVLAASFESYIRALTVTEALSKTSNMSKVTYLREVADKATFIYRLKEGDTFYFLDEIPATEYTFVKLDEEVIGEDRALYCIVTKRYLEPSESIKVENYWRPVILTSEVSGLDLDKGESILKKYNYKLAEDDD